MRQATCSLAAEFSMVKENILIQDERITQLYVIQSKADPFLWFGVLFVDSGIYMGSVLRFNMLVPTNYPNSPCPKIYLDPIPYHPLVDPDTGEVDTKNAFPDWISTTHRFHQLLAFLKRLIYNPELYLTQIESLLLGAGFDFDQIQNKQNDNQNEVANSSHMFLSDGNDNEPSSSGRGGVKDNNLIRSQKDINLELDVEKVEGNKKYPELEQLFNNFDHTVKCMKLYLCDNQEFNQLTNVFKRKCGFQMFDKPNIPLGDDDNAIIFQPWDPQIHETTRQCILEGRFAPTSLFAAYNRDTDRVSFIPGAESTP